MFQNIFQLIVTFSIIDAIIMLTFIKSLASPFLRENIEISEEKLS